MITQFIDFSLVEDVNSNLTKMLGIDDKAVEVLASASDEWFVSTEAYIASLNIDVSLENICIVAPGLYKEVAEWFDENYSSYSDVARGVLWYQMMSALHKRAHNLISGKITKKVLKESGFEGTLLDFIKKLSNEQREQFGDITDSEGTE
jgi:hypothetical protein